ncbi:cbb3-type cytochrome oxidase subunit 3 [Roseospirillum parvum]|uniref:Cytochrome c oxidase cbb3-type subunit 4 n=1 Tax=Roseospirillum parvum TaxID=83401 RepID=A0A1G7WP19_9PROT|nr:cbb3-type cytochrome c oxidase subunit 3 [Roseospirillum parvum]SDG73682.1 cytochrome c oxidase cbb3-type subunit 4 [Roseospirillum parvum]
MQDVSELLSQFWGLWLLILFVGIIVWVFKPGNKDRLESQAMIPLNDDDEEHDDGGRS